MRSVTRSWMPLAAVVALLVAFGLGLGAVAEPPEADEGPDGFGTMIRMLRRRGISVAHGPVPARGTLLLLPGPASRVTAAAVTRWVREGGRVVLADPRHPVAAMLGVPGEDPIASVGPSRTATDCVTRSTVGVSQILHDGDDPRWSAPPANAVPCFRGGGDPWMVEMSVDEGDAVLIGGPGPFTNALIREADNAILAWNLFGRSGEPLTVGTFSEERTGLWGLLPGPVRASLIGLGLAVTALVVARGRRMGRPHPERDPSPIPAHELVLATARLYRRGRMAGHAVSLIQDAFRTRVEERMGISVGEDPGSLVTGAEVPGAERALRPRPQADERELLEIAATVETLERRTEGER